MGIYKTLDSSIEEVDVIIAGGGTAGCVLAGRLATADPNLSILVIEGGQDNYQNPSIVTPAMFPTHTLPGSKTAIFYRGRKSEHLAGREVWIPSGGVLGGGSSINFMMYTRAQREDYDSWNTPGWTADELHPYLTKLETYDGSTAQKQHHGVDGPVHVSDGTLRMRGTEEEFIRAAAQVGGWAEKPDLQTFGHDNNNAFAHWKRYVSPDGKRSDAAHMYLHPVLRDGQHPNLHVLVESQVVRVLFDDDKRASGVEYHPNPLFQSSDGDSDGVVEGKKRTIRARKLVVVSSGACGTPMVLERSGIGAADVLAAAGVPLVEELPGVGRDYQDHHFGIWPYRTSLAPHETLDELLSGRLSFEDAMRNKDPRLGWNTIDVAGKLRPSEDDIVALGPAMKKAWERDFKDKPNRPMMIMGLLNSYFGPPGSADPGQYVSLGAFSLYTYSRGHIHITGPEVAAPYDFDVGYFSDAGEVDVKKHMWAYKKGREIVRRTSMYRGELESAHPPFPADSKAACVKLDARQDTASLKDIEYSAEDDRILEQFLRESINTTWHSLGTAKMAPREKLGVVDPDLNVYGVKGLKLVDMSIAPENIGGNTNNTALAIGEKAADIIAKGLGLGRS